MSKFLVVQAFTGKVQPGDTNTMVCGGALSLSFDTEQSAISAAKAYAVQFPGQLFRVYRAVALVENRPQVDRIPSESLYTPFVSSVPYGEAEAKRPKGKR